MLGERKRRKSLKWSMFSCSGSMRRSACGFLHAKPRCKEAHQMSTAFYHSCQHIADRQHGMARGRTLGNDVCSSSCKALPKAKGSPSANVSQTPGSWANSVTNPKSKLDPSKTCQGIRGVTEYFESDRLHWQLGTCMAWLKHRNTFPTPQPFGYKCI